MLITPGICIELIATIFTYFYLKNDKSIVWKCFIPYMVFVSLSELAGRYIAVFGDGNNSWLYNIALIFEIGILNLMFTSLFKTYQKGQSVLYIGLALIALAYGYDLFDHGFGVYNSNTRKLLSISMVMYSLIYFYLLLKEERYVILRNYAPFWWVAGVLLSFSGSTISNLSFMKIEIYILDKYPLRYVIFIVLNLILYFLWSYSFYCRYRQNKI